MTIAAGIISSVKKVATNTPNPNEIAISAMNSVLGGTFTSRVNMNLREDKGWSYGAQTLMFDANGQRPFVIYAPVQTDRTMESMQEITNELEGIVDDNPPTRDEVVKVQSTMSSVLAGRWETNNAIQNSISQIVRFGYEDDYFDNYAQRVRSLNIEQVASAAREVVRPENLVWVVVGDREKIEPGIRELNLGEIHIMDTDGNVLD